MTDKPKRPMSAYLLWLNASREKIKADNPGLRVTEIAKKAGELWRSMDDKSEWEERAAEAKEQYAKELESFNANGGVTPSKKAQKRGKAKPVRAVKTKVKKEESEDEEDDEEENSE